MSYLGRLAESRCTHMEMQDGSKNGSFLFKKVFFYVCLFLRDRERQRMSRERAEREADTESEGGSRL